MADIRCVRYPPVSNCPIMRLAQQIASIHPALFTTIFVLGSAGLFLMQADPSLSDAALVTSLSFLLVGAWFLWLWAIYTLATDEAANSRRWTIAYVAGPLILLLSELLIRHQALDRDGALGTILSLAQTGLVVCCVWKSAEALEVASRGKGVPVTRIGRTAAFLFFWVVGVWALRTKVLDIAARSRSNAHQPDVG
jgi:hypothetical protein